MGGVTIAGEDAAEADDDNDREIEGDDTPKGPLEFAAGAVGGTFDRLHAGHRLLLATAAAATDGVLYVGVTGDSLLRKKVSAPRHAFAGRRGRLWHGCGMDRCKLTLTLVAAGARRDVAIL